MLDAKWTTSAVGPSPTDAKWSHAVELWHGVWPCDQKLRRGGGGDLGCDRAGAAGCSYRCDRGASAPISGCGCDACCGCGCGCGCGACFGFGCDASLGCDVCKGCAHQGCGCAAPAAGSGYAAPSESPAAREPESQT